MAGGLFLTNRSPGGSGPPAAGGVRPTPSSPADIATDHLRDAAGRLGLIPGQRVQGSFTDPGGDKLTLDARVSNEGSIGGTLTTPQGQVQLLATDGLTFVKGSRAFWSAHGAPLGELSAYAAQWVKSAPDLFGVDLTAYLAPQLLAEDLAPGEFFEPDDVDGPVPTATPAGTADVNGVPTEIIDSSTGLRAYVTTTEPRRIVRLAARPGAHLGTGAGPTASPSGTRTAALVRPGLSQPGAIPALRLADDTSLDIDLSDLSPQEMDQFYSELQGRIIQLKAAVDSQVQVSLNGTVTLAPCGPDGCQANVTLSNQVSSSSQYLSVKEPVTLSVTIVMTLDGRPVRTCNNTVTMPPNGSARTTCFATYVIPPERNPTQHEILAEVTAYGRAFVDADIKQLTNDVAEEVRSNRQLPTTEPTPPATAGPSGGASPSPTGKTYPCAEPTIGDAAGGPGEWATVNRGGDFRPDAPWRSYQEQVTGVRLNTEYRVQRPGASPVEFEGFSTDGGKTVFTEAKSVGYAGRLAGARLDPKKGLVVDSGAAQRQLDTWLEQQRRQLDVVSRVPGARLRFVAAENDAVLKMEAYAKTNLSDDLFKLIDFEHEAKDWSFRGCP